jgi:hypothetical protein
VPWLLFVLPALADPWLDPVATRAADCARASGADALVGDGRWRPLEAASKLGLDGVSACAALGGGLDHRLAEGWAWGVTPSLRIAGGDATPDNLGGDAERGLVSTAARVSGELWGPWGAVIVEPELLAGVAPTGAELRFAALWGELRWRGLSLGVGARDRWLGPGRHGSLLVSDNARPPWLGTAVAEGRLPGWFDRLGRLRVEAGAGVLAEPRDDVTHPGLLLIDMRWAPVSWVELGATRLSIFGGEGRPAVDVGQLLLPTEPHVYDDPDQLLPDQNELASLDFRVTLPLARWVGGPVDYVEGWWQYGGEDVIGRKLGPIPYPSLAGVGNLYGGAVKLGPIVVTGEYTRLLDDYFRWYVGHRVYHDGFTQRGRVMGHFGGPDSETAFGAVAWDGAPLRARLWGDWTRRVGVIEAQNNRLFTFMTEERALRLGVDVGASLARRVWGAAGYSFERVTGDDFVPGAEAGRHRVYVELAPARPWTGRLGQR